MDILYNGKKIGSYEIESQVFNDKHYYVFSDFTIFDEYRNKGFGRKTLEYIVDTYYPILLWVYADNYIAKHLYKSFGFKPLDIDYSTCDLECLVYE